jgi:hypothetical protein
MPFAYYARLTRAQQAVYRKSDGITEIRLDRPAELHPLVGALDAALRTEDRLETQRATAQLIRGLTEALLIPPVKVEVLAARPHAKWGELHGLYTVERGKPPKIQLWMRTAKQKRVVAFRTYMRTLLHEVGHHIDYALLRLPDSFHTEGFYKRESSLFYQLVPEAARPDAAPAVRPVEEWAALAPTERLQRLERTPSELARLMRGQTDAALSRRPAPDAWSAKDIVCHLRDAEEHLNAWVGLMLVNDEPPLLPATVARWAHDRQYAHQHAGAAWDAFGRRRDDTLEIFRALTPRQWQYAGRRARRRLTIDHVLALMAWHDETHVDQLRAALRGDGKPLECGILAGS